MRRQLRPVESHDLPGMTDAIRSQEAAAAEYRGEELTAELVQPLGDISKKTGDMERNSPLFAGTLQPTLF